MDCCFFTNRVSVTTLPHTNLHCDDIVYEVYYFLLAER